MIGNLLNKQLEIRRNAPASPAAVDEWNQPIYAPDATIVTVPGTIQPISVKDVEALTDAGAQIGDFTGYTAYQDVRLADRVRDAGTGETYEVRGSWDMAGRGLARKLLLRRVTP